MARLVLPLSDADATVESVGGKGQSLARLARAGLPVPTGFHITTEAYRQFVSENKLQSRLLAALDNVDASDPAALEPAARQIGSFFAEAAMPAEVAAAISNAYHALKDIPVAVRSSATAEDSPEASFAGQLETYLNVRGEARVLEAVRRCWTSLSTARAMGYRARHHIAPQDVSLAVVVQQLVPAEAAGILFTANPVTGARDQVVINAAWGLGEAVVGGLVTPDTIVVDRVSGRIAEQRLQRKEVMTVRTADGTREQAVPPDRRDRAVLRRAQVTKLARLGLKIEALFGQPVDVEWALDHGHLFVLQARSITTLPGHNPAAGEWNDSLTGDYLWTSTNYGEAVPDVMTPCTWSLARILLDDAEPAIGEYHVYGNIGGRLYKNLSIDFSLVAAVGLSPKRFAAMVEDAFGRLPTGQDIPTIHLSLGYLLREMLPVALRDTWQMRANLKRMPAFLAGAPERCEALRARIAAITCPAELAALWQAEVLPFFHEAGQMVRAAANQGNGAVVMVRRDLQKRLGPADADALLTGPGAGGSELASLGPLLALTQLANGEIDPATYARRFGHRGPHEAEISIPRPAEDPNWIATQRAGLGQARKNVDALLARQTAVRQAAWERLSARGLRQAAALRRQIDRWTRLSHEREATRSENIRAFWVVRTFVQRAGALTGQGDDLFFLYLDEILALLGGDGASLAYVAARRAAYARYCALPPYPVLIRGRFDPFQWTADPQRRSDLYVAKDGPPASDGEVITGLPGAEGVVEGVVRVIASADEGDQLQVGEVLVTHVTNVGWTPLFPRAIAVVTDVGAPLSHAAIVARELGLPAVVGCGDATLRLHTGDRVRVDGGRGRVEILQPVNDMPGRSE